MDQQDDRPTIICGDLANPPAALRPLIERPRWAIWRLIRRGDGWCKPPYQSNDPERFADMTDLTDWSDYRSALSAVLSGLGDGVTYLLTEDDALGAFDVDDVRDPVTGTIAEWGQRLLNRANGTYAEITPSGTGLRIWGSAKGEPLHRHFNNLEGGASLELFRRTLKPLTVTGLQIGDAGALGDVDALMDAAEAWGNQQRHRQAAAGPRPNGPIAPGLISQCSDDQIELIVREGAPAGANRSDLFHGVVGHYQGIGWTIEQIEAHLAPHPDGIAARYIAEDRLLNEVARSFNKFTQQRGGQELPPQGAWVNGWQPPKPELNQPEPELCAHCHQALGTERQDAHNGGWLHPRCTMPFIDARETEEGISRPELKEPWSEEQPKPEQPRPEQPQSESEQSELEPEEEPAAPAIPLPRMYCYGDPDPRPLASDLVKGLIPAVGHGLLSGQWGLGKSFISYDLGACTATGQPFLGHMIRRQSGSLYLVAEGQSRLRARFKALVQGKCGDASRMPICWFEDVPLLLERDGLDTLVEMGRQAEASLQREFGLPLGLVVIDTIAAAAGYAKEGSESDNAIAQRVMNVLNVTGQKLGCFVLGNDHFGKKIELGTRGGSAKEGSGDVVLAVLGDRTVDGPVTNTRLIIRKVRDGETGETYPFELEKVTVGHDEDGDPITSMIVNWKPKAAASSQSPSPPKDPWAEDRQGDTRSAMLLLKRVMMAKLAERGTELPLDPPVRGIDQEIVRAEFYAQTPTDGTTPKQRADVRLKRFRRAVERAIDKRLIDAREIGNVTYFWLLHQAEAGGEF